MIPDMRAGHWRAVREMMVGRRIADDDLTAGSGVSLTVAGAPGVKV